MDERLKFIARLLDGEKMAPMCREFGISRVTGYKIFNRYKECGLDALNDRSRRPYRHANSEKRQHTNRQPRIAAAASSREPVCQLRSARPSDQEP